MFVGRWEWSFGRLDFVESTVWSGHNADMDPEKAQQLAAELEVEMMADMYNR